MEIGIWSSNIKHGYLVTVNAEEFDADSPHTHGAKDCE